MESEREIDREAEELFRDFRFSIRLGRRQEVAKDYAPWRRILAEKGMESGDGEAPAQEEETENDSMDAGPSVEADFFSEMVNDLADGASEVVMETDRSFSLETGRGLAAENGKRIQPAAQAAKPKPNDGSSDAWAAEKWTATEICS